MCIRDRTAVALSPLSAIIATAIGIKRPLSPMPPASSSSVARALPEARLLSKPSTSAPDRRHRARRLHKAGLVDAVFQLLAPNRLAQDCCDLRVACAIAQWLAQVGLSEREEAGPQATLGGEADAVALGAERLGDRADEADRPGAVGEPVDPGGRVGIAAHRLQRVLGFDRSANLLPSQHLLLRPGAVGVERHELDEANLVGMVPGLSLIHISE